MNPAASLLTIDGVALDVDVSSRKRAFEELAHLFESVAGVPHREAFEALNNRERLGCTALGGGVAIPHGRVRGLDKIVVALLRAQKPVVFDTPDNRRARIFFGILVPADDTEHYLPVLATVAALLKDRATKEALLEAKEPLDVCKIVSAFEPPEESPENAKDGEGAPAGSDKEEAGK